MPSIPPNNLGRRFPNRQSTINTPVPDAIPPRTCTELMEELMALNSSDLKQIRKMMNNMFPIELELLTKTILKIRSAAYEIKYSRSPKGIEKQLKRKSKP